MKKLSTIIDNVITKKSTINESLKEADLVTIFDQEYSRLGIQPLHFKNVDTILMTEKLYCAIEYKCVNFSEIEMYRIFSQLLGYSKTNIDEFQVSVGVCIDRVFMIPTPVLSKHINIIPDGVSPSSLYTNNEYQYIWDTLKSDQYLTNNIVILDSSEITIFDLYKIIENTSIGVKRKIMPILNEILKKFNTKVLNNTEYKSHNFNEVKMIFMNILMKQFSLDEAKSEMYITVSESEAKKIKIDKNEFSILNSMYNMELKPSQIAEISIWFDKLSEKVFRRGTGEYYTPIKLAVLVIQLINNIGKKYKFDPYIYFTWWDPCCATMNLFNPIIEKIERPFASTLFGGDLFISNVNKTNGEFQKWSRDFLNDDLDICKSRPQICKKEGPNKGKLIKKTDKKALRKLLKQIDDPRYSPSPPFDLPLSLLKVFQSNEPILFHLNPPMSFPGGINEKRTLDSYEYDTNGRSLSRVFMENDYALEYSTTPELYINFLYVITLYRRFYRNSNIWISTFLLPTFFTGYSWKKFRNYFFSMYKLEEGIIFPSSVFPDLDGDWGMCHCVFSPNEQPDKISFNLTCLTESLEKDINYPHGVSLVNCDSAETPFLKEKLMEVIQ